MTGQHSKETIHQGADLLFAVLYCPECAGDVPHRVAYKRGIVAETECTVCGRALAVSRRQRPVVCGEGPALASTTESAGASPSKASGYAAVGGLPFLSELPISPRRLGSLAVELPVRAMTKPGRLLREVRRDGAGVLLSVPRRAVTKPVRIMAELAGVARRAR